MRSVWTGLLGAALALLWQTLVVHSKYQGNWTGLFYTGALLEQPPSLAAEGIYRFSNSRGYDGQFYHYIAHDPFIRGDEARYIDAPALRYRRILIPLAAHVLALGRSQFIDRAFVASILIFVFLGAYWLSAFFSLHGFDPKWGLTFLAIPGVLISIDRLTIDIGVIALSVALALYFARGANLPLYATLVAAPLARETGLLLVAACVSYLLLKRRWRQALLFSSAALPAAAWYAYTYVELATYRTHPGRWFSAVPFAPLVHRLLNPTVYPLPPLAAFAATVLDYLALAGAIFAMAIGYAALRRLKAGPVEIGLVLFALLATFVSVPGGWTDVYGFARWLAPLTVFAALDGVRRREWLNVLPLLMILPRVALQLAPHAMAMVRYLAGDARRMGIG